MSDWLHEWTAGGRRDERRVALKRPAQAPRTVSDRHRHGVALAAIAASCPLSSGRRGATGHHTVTERDRKWSRLRERRRG
jgi:hypothetical protein